jgi:hypothetical protein
MQRCEVFMDLILDSDVQAVAEFMQRTIPAGKLMPVAEKLSSLARLLWEKYPQEPCVGLTLAESALTRGLLRDASVSDLEPSCVGDGSEVEACCR